MGGQFSYNVLTWQIFFLGGTLQRSTNNRSRQDVNK